MPRPISPRAVPFLMAGLLLCGALARAGVGPAETPPGAPPAVPAQSDCRNMADAEIVAAIHEKIKADRRFDGQWRHIHVSSRDRVVILRGWVKGRVQLRALVRYASTTPCVRRVNNRAAPFRAVGCPPGTRRCGDTCIGRDEDCTLLQ